MSFLSRLFKKVEKVNKNESSIEELDMSLSLDEEALQEEAMEQWVSMAENIIINSVKAVNNNVERAFILIDFNESLPSFNIFYQVDGQLYDWDELQDEDAKSKIEHQLLSQAKEVTTHLHKLFDEANLERIGYAQLQFEAETLAWFSHIIWSNSEESFMERDVMLHEWFSKLKDYIVDLPLDSNQKLPWYP